LLDVEDLDAAPGDYAGVVMDRSSALSRLVTQATPAEIARKAATVGQWLGAKEPAPDGPEPVILPPGSGDHHPCRRVRHGEIDGRIQHDRSPVRAA
jgi:hypothetical protein